MFSYLLVCTVSLAVLLLYDWITDQSSPARTTTDSRISDFILFNKFVCNKLKYIHVIHHPLRLFLVLALSCYLPGWHLIGAVLDVLV